MEENVITNRVIVRPISKNVAKELIVKNHYSHTWTKCNTAFGIFYKETDKFFGDEGEKLIGTMVYGDPIGRQVVQSISPVLKNGEVLELTRLWVSDNYGRNIESYCIGQSFKWLRVNKPEVKVIISYSDPEQNHLGIIYQATNFNYQGDSTRIVDAWWYRFPTSSVWLHPRTVVSMYGSVTPKKLLIEYPNGYEIRELKRKHRYIYFLCKGKERAKLLKTIKHPFKPYPKLDDLHEEKIIKITKENI